MPKHNQFLGKEGERYALKYLVNSGYHIISQNVYIAGGEIDIVAKEDDMIIFVEVKTRCSELYVALIDTLSDEKIDSLQTSCEEYIIKHRLEDCEYRIDLIGVIVHGNKMKKLIHERSVI